MVSSVSSDVVESPDKSGVAIQKPGSGTSE
jgi:hypothetical protein